MEKEKLSRFSEILSQMRKERGISQKKAATDLGISQALLSHYEKGIRECGLDFVIKCSKYYNVTTDYLLGISDNRNGISTDLVDIIDGGRGSIKNLAAATKCLLDTAAAATVSSQNKYVYDYFMLSAYRGALTLAKAGVLPKEMFKLDYTIARELTAAAIALQDAKFVLIEDKSRNGFDEMQSTAIQSLIEEAEEHILQNFIMD